MNRSLAFIGALVAAGVAVSSACFAEAPEPIRFTLETQRGDPAKIHASFQHQGQRDNDDRWSTGLMPSDLIGLEVSSFHAPGTRAVHFAVVREPGRLDCTGSGGGGFAAGTCRFSENEAFMQLLTNNGIGRPTYDQALGLMAVNTHGELIRAMAAAHYPTPRIGDLMALSALGVDGRYITEMSRAGYRPQTVQKLIEFKALGITPLWIAGFVRVGYANVPGDGLVQMRALGITPDYIERFQRIGYRTLPVSTLVQLKALDITPDFVRSIAREGEPIPPVSKLVELKVFAKRH
ncbi:MAG TPA: hypothetical protein VGU01_03765 [Sphingomicrobium sp.]|nr:hypothetical protein [Sphingomicrobium sp.]